ncbi:MAG: hypothetical protein NT157_04685 [Candidatus Micrarchaeota archaeon]|nr:hypothetical protein [Candidatus Micrarchaeota archaeon]
MNVKMKEVRIAAHKDDADGLVGSLHELGVMHIREPKAPVPARTTDEFDTLAKLEYIIRFPYFAKEKKPLVSNFTTLPPSEKIKNLEETAKKGLAMIGVCGELEKIEREIEDAKKTIAQLGALRREIAALRFTTPIPLHRLGQTRHAVIFLSKSPAKGADSAKVGESIYLCAAIQGSEAYAASKPIELDLLGLKGTPELVVKASVRLLDELREKISSLVAEAKRREQDLLYFKAAYDYVSLRVQKESALSKATETRGARIFAGWVSEEDEQKVKGLADCDVELSEVKGDNAPTKLKNNLFVAPFEVVTRIFGMPKYTEFDPTPYLFPFFLLSAALCLTDAGYGVMLLIASLWLYFSYKLQFAKLLFAISILTIPVGILIGGWFGNLGDYVPAFKPYLYPDGMSPLDFLVLAIAIGIIQIAFGLLVAVKGFAVRRDWGNAADKALWFVFICSLVVYALDGAGLIDFENVYYVSIASMLLIMALSGARDRAGIFSKIMTAVVAPYNIVAYVGDALSYSRIMALGLTTGIIGTVVNTVAVITLAIPFAGLPIALAVLLVGHTFNLAISTLAAYVHSSRLQYVEFFGKFFEGGGFRFRPFVKEYKYVKEV